VNGYRQGSTKLKLCNYIKRLFRKFGYTVDAVHPVRAITHKVATAQRCGVTRIWKSEILANGKVLTGRSFSASQVFSSPRFLLPAVSWEESTGRIGALPMTTLSSLSRLLHPTQLTRGRIAIALIAALLADGLQVLLQAVPLVPQLIDVAATVIVTLAIGFNILLLPTFVIELVPLVDDFPTWTGCVLAVIALRRRKERIAVVD
jgi:hypothetical protein